MEKGTVGTGVAGLVGNIVKLIYSGKAGLSIASPIAVIAAILRLLAAMENLELCAEANGIDMSALRDRRLKLQQEVEELQRRLDASKAAAP